MKLKTKTKISGIILAAGEAKRFGKPKQLIPWKNKTLIRHVYDVAVSSNLNEVHIVTGAYHELIKEEFSSQGVSIISNQEWKNGQSTSMKAGILALDEGIEAALFLLCDQPFISKELINKLLETSSELNKPIIAPSVLSKRSNPVLFQQAMFSELLTVQGDKGGRALFGTHEVYLIPWHDEKILMDIDDHEDLIKAKEAQS